MACGTTRVRRPHLQALLMKAQWHAMRAVWWVFHCQAVSAHYQLFPAQ